LSRRASPGLYAAKTSIGDEGLGYYDIAINENRESPLAGYKLEFVIESVADTVAENPVNRGYLC
jgi:hypothetical protein